MKTYFIYTPIFLACAAAAQADDNKLSVSSERTDYSKAFGERHQTTAEWSTDLGRTAFTIKASRAKRGFDDEKYSAVQVAGTVYHDWSDRFYTRTSASVSSNKPVFASREIANDFNFKLLPGAVLTAGGKYARYNGNRDVRSWSAGGTWYFGGGFATYRYSAYDIERLGKSHGHLATVRLKDGRGSGSTQLWLGAGSSLHEQELVLSGRQGSYRSVALQRVQPVKGRLSVTATLGRAWYDTSAANYRGTTASIGLSYSGWRPF